MLHNSSADKSPPPAQLRATLALFGITILWGATFLIVHLAMRTCGPLFFVGLRFGVAAAVSLLCFAPAMRGLTRRELVGGIAIGTTIFLGYVLQSHGLRTISSSQSAFITAFYVPMVPLLQLCVLFRPPHPMSWLGIGLAFVGLLFVAGPQRGSFTFNEGEIVTLVSTIAIAAEIILIGHFGAGSDGRRITMVQLLAASALSFGMMPMVGEALPAFSWVWLASAGGLGAITALIQLTMNWAQKSVSPTRATVIYAGESIWAGLVGRLAGDRLPGLALVGATLIVVGVIVSEWRPIAKEAAA